jgi:hypothetical protein
MHVKVHLLYESGCHTLCKQHYGRKVLFAYVSISHQVISTVSKLLVMT